MPKTISDVINASGSFDPKQKIQSSTVPTDFVGSENVIIATTGYSSGNSQYSQEAVDNAKIIGLLQQFSMSQMRQNPTIFEIGSAGKYVVHSNRVGGGIRLSKMVYNGPNVLASLYPYSDANTTKLKQEYGRHWLLNLAGDIFARPIGLVVIFRDAAYNIVAGAFFEHAMISDHGLGVNANNPMLGENISIQYERVIPMFQHDSDTVKLAGASAS